MKPRNLGNARLTLNLGFLMLMAAISVVLLVGAVLALIRGSAWTPVAITIMVSSALSAAVAVFKLFAHHSSR